MVVDPGQRIAHPPRDHRARKAQGAVANEAGRRKAEVVVAGVGVDLRFRESFEGKMSRLEKDWVDWVRKLP